MLKAQKHASILLRVSGDLLQLLQVKLKQEVQRHGLRTAALLAASCGAVHGLKNVITKATQHIRSNPCSPWYKFAFAMAMHGCHWRPSVVLLLLVMLLRLARIAATLDK